MKWRRPWPLRASVLSELLVSKKSFKTPQSKDIYYEYVTKYSLFENSQLVRSQTDFQTFRLSPVNLPRFPRGDRRADLTSCRGVLHERVSPRESINSMMADMWSQPSTCCSFMTIKQRVSLCLKLTVSALTTWPAAVIIVASCRVASLTFHVFISDR